MTSSTPPSRPVPTSTPVLKKAMAYGALAAAVIAIVGALVGALTAGVPGVMGAVLGTGMALVFLAVTAASILFSNRFIRSEVYVAIFFAFVLGSWLVKFVVFVVVEIVLAGQAWVSPLFLFVSIVAQVVASLIVDVVVITRARMPHVSDVLPRADSHGDDPSHESAG